MNLDVKVSFRSNEINEKRMPDELINELKSRIKSKSNDLKLHYPTIERISNSSILGNLLSHDNPFNLKLVISKLFGQIFKKWNIYSIVKMMIVKNQPFHLEILTLLQKKLDVEVVERQNMIGSKKCKVTIYKNNKGQVPNQRLVYINKVRPATALTLSCGT